MRFSKMLLASLFLAAVVAVPVYAHISFNTPQTYAQCDGNCESCPNTGCRNNPNYKPDSSKSDKSGSDAKSGADKPAPDKSKDEAPAKK